MSHALDRPAILIAGASRGLGLALAAEFLGRGWHVICPIRVIETLAPLVPAGGLTTKSASPK